MYFRGSRNLKWVTWHNTPISENVCHHRLGLAMVSPHTKFELSVFTHNEDMTTTTTTTTTSPPRVIWEECIALAQLRNRVPIGYNGTPQIHPQNCPFDDHHPHLIHPSLDRPTHHPKWHPDAISRFATVHILDKHRQTGRWDRRQVYAILIDSDTLIIHANKIPNICPVIMTFEYEFMPISFSVTFTGGMERLWKKTVRHVN